MFDVADDQAPCPCSSGRAFGQCCGPVLRREQAAPTAEALMRSRYTAFVTDDMDHLLRTLDNRKRKTFSAAKTAAWNADVEWKGLAVLAVDKGGTSDTTGTVTFRADFLKAGEPGAINEKSRFKKKGGRWYYVDGDVSGA